MKAAALYSYSEIDSKQLMQTEGHDNDLKGFARKMLRLESRFWLATGRQCKMVTWGVEI